MFNRDALLHWCTDDKDSPFSSYCSMFLHHGKHYIIHIFLPLILDSLVFNLFATIYMAGANIEHPVEIEEITQIIKKL